MGGQIQRVRVAVMSAQLPPCRCLQCGELLNRAFDPAHGGRMPSSGDATICCDCGHVMIFNNELRLREPNADEWRSLDADPFVRMIRALHRQFLRERVKH
jgi:hypothetical protein